MNSRIRMSLAVAAVLCSTLYAQDPQTPAGAPPAQSGVQREPGGWRNRMGRGVAGTVTEVTADHFTIKNEGGETWTVHYSANTRIMKQQPQAMRGVSPGGQAGGNAPTPIKASDIKVGDMIMAMGERDETAKSVGAMAVIQLDPERAKQMRDMQANFGKTWLMGRVTAINETKITLHSGVDNADHTVVVDENTSFRRRREPVTLGDVQVGQNLRAEGAVKDGQFVATTVNVMMLPTDGGPVRREGPPPQ